MPESYSTTTPEWAIQGNAAVMSGVKELGSINPAIVSGKLKPGRRMIPSEDDFVNGVEIISDNTKSITTMIVKNLFILNV